MAVDPMAVDPMADPMTPDVRRILVGLDGSLPSREALVAATLLAQVLEAELEGLFVEEEIWHRVGSLMGRGVESGPVAEPGSAALVGARLIGGYTGMARPTVGEGLGRELRALARKMALHLEEVSARASLRSRFRVERGRPEAVILLAAADADLVTVGRVGRSHGRAGRLGTTARTLVEKSDTPVLLLPQGARLGGRVVVIPDGERPGGHPSPGPVSGLALGAQLARTWEAPLLVILPRPQGAGSASGEGGVSREERRMLEIRGQLDRMGVEDAALHLVSSLNPATLGRLLGTDQGTLVVVERGSPLVAGERLEGTLAALRRVAMLLV